MDSDIADFSRRDITLLGQTKPVLLTGATGPAVIVIHEVYGFTPTLARFCRWVRDAGFRVYAPILFGSPDAGNTEKPTLGRILSLCVSREFTLLATNKPIERLKPLVRLAAALGKLKRPFIMRLQLVRAFGGKQTEPQGQLHFDLAGVPDFALTGRVQQAQTSLEMSNRFDVSKLSRGMLPRLQPLIDRTFAYAGSR